MKNSYLNFTNMASEVMLFTEQGPVAQSDARPTGSEEVAGSIIRSGTILSLRLIM